MNRRGFLGSILVTGAAPLVVTAIPSNVPSMEPLSESQLTALREIQQALIRLGIWQAADDALDARL